MPDDPYQIHLPPNPTVQSRPRRVNRSTTREAQQVISQILEEGKAMAEEIRMKEKEVNRMELQEEETC